MSASSLSVPQPSLEEPRSVVQQLVTKFFADADVDAINRVNEAFQLIQEQRAQKLSTSRDLLHQWMKKVEAAKWEAQRPADRPAARHSEDMSNLERERFNLAKSINDLEASVVQFEGVLASQKSTLAHLQDENGPAGREGLSRIELEWNLYKQLGIDWIEGGSAAEQVVRCRVKDVARNDIHLVDLDSQKLGAVQQADLLWSLVSPQ